MRVVFMGTPEFAQTILEALIDSNHEIVGVVTRPDAVRSRGKKLISSPVKQCALDHDISVLEYSSLRSDEAYEALAALNADVFCVAAYGAILPKRILEMPHFGCLNVHGSLLPRWRGAAPIERAILAGDEQTGIGIMRMEEGLDTGAVAKTCTVDIDNIPATELSHILALQGGSALVQVLDVLESGELLEWCPQPNDGVTYAEKLTKGELDLSPDMPSLEAKRCVQASSEHHPSRCVVAGKELTVVSASLADSDVTVDMGQVAFLAKRLYIGFEDGVLELRTVKPAGKKNMDAKAFAAGIHGFKQGGICWSSING